MNNIKDKNVNRGIRTQQEDLVTTIAQAGLYLKAFCLYLFNSLLENLMDNILARATRRLFTPLYNPSYI